MNKVVASIPDTLVNPRKNLVGFTAFTAPLRGLCLFSSRFGKHFLVLAKKAWVLHKRTIGKGSKVS